MDHPNKGRKQAPEHIRKRIESVKKAKAAWTDERRKEFADRIREANKKRDPELQKRFLYSNIGREPWCKGKKIPQISGENHWNWGGNMPQESIEKMRQSLTGKKQSPELVAKRMAARAGYRHTDEVKSKIGEANRGERNGMSGRVGPLNPTWRGGVSFEPYPTAWTFRLREAIRNRDGRTCRVCGARENGIRLDVHHIDYDKKNIAPENLVSLCHPCHMKTSFNRDYWKEYFNQPLSRTGTDD